MAHSKRKAAEDFIIAFYSTRIIKDIKSIVTDDFTMRLKKGIFVNNKEELENFAKTYYEKYPESTLYQEDSSKKALREDGKFRMKFHLESFLQDGKQMDQSGWIVIDFFEPKQNRFYVKDVEIFSDHELDLPESTVKLTIENAMKEIELKDVEHKEKMLRPKYLSAFHGKFLKGNIPV